MAASSGFDPMSQEYEAQFFGWTPKSFSDGMYNAVLEYTWETFSAAQEFIKQQHSDCVSEEQLHKAATQKFFPKITHVIDKAFDKFELYLLTNILHIPEHVVLPEDRIQATAQYSAEDEKLLDQTLTDLKNQIHSTRLTNECMRREIEQLDKVQRLYSEFAHFQSQLDTICKEAGVSDLRESLIFGSDKAQKIKSLLARIQPMKESSLEDINTEDIEFSKRSSEENVCMDE